MAPGGRNFHVKQIRQIQIHVRDAYVSRSSIGALIGKLVIRYECSSGLVGYLVSAFRRGLSSWEPDTETVGMEVGDTGSRGKDGTGVGAYRSK